MEKLKAEIEQIGDEYRLRSSELNELCRTKEALDDELANSVLKRRAC